MTIFKLEIFDQCDGSTVERTEYFLWFHAAQAEADKNKFYDQDNCRITEIEVRE